MRCSFQNSLWVFLGACCVVWFIAGEASADGRISGEVSAVYAHNRAHAEVFARGVDGYLHYFYVSGGKWRHDGNSFRRGGKVAGSISAVYASNRRHAEVFYRGADGYLHYFYVSGGSWRHDGNSFRRGGQVAGEISAVYSDNRGHAEVYYHGTDGYLHYFYVSGGSWRHDTRSLRSCGKVSGAVSAVYVPDLQHTSVAFRGADGYLRYLFVKSGRWTCISQAFRFRNYGRVAGSISAAAYPLGQVDIFFRGDDGYLRAFYYVGGWVSGGNFRVAGKVGGRISALYAHNRGHSEVFFMGADRYPRMFYAVKKPPTIRNPWTKRAVVLPRKDTSVWRLDANNLRKGSAGTGALSAVYGHHRGHTEFLYLPTDGYLTSYFVHRGRWHLDRRSIR